MRWEGSLQGFSGLEMLEVEARGQGSSGKSGCVNGVKSSAPGEEDHFLHTRGVTSALPLGCSGTAVVTWLVACKTQVTLAVTGERHWGATGARQSLRERVCAVSHCLRVGVPTGHGCDGFHREKRNRS